MRTPRAPAWRVFVLALLLASAALMFCSKSSPAYPINDWTDANIYLSVGKGMAGGQVVYRDLYDHKGPLIYALHALCAMVSPMSFAGVFALECLCGAAFLYLAYRLMELCGINRLKWAAVALVAVSVYSSYSFQQGDSAEELCLPLLLYALYDMLRWIRLDGGAPMRFGRVAVHGALFGCVFWTKFTLAGAQAGFLLTLIIAALSKRDIKQALLYVCAYLAGFALSTLPWLIYFGANGAIYDWLKVYLYDNIFLYSGGEGAGLRSRLKDIALSGVDWLWRNLLYTAPLLAGLAWGVLKRGAARLERVALLLIAGLAAIGVFIGGKSYPYYGLALAFLCPLGFAAIFGIAEKPVEKRLNDATASSGRRAARRALSLAFAACAAASCYLLSPNVPEGFLMPRERTMQYQLAKVMDAYDSPTLLNYGFMDAGFYTAAGITPSVKYFHRTNVPLQEMLDEQTRYVDEGVCDFVVTRGLQPDSIDELYELAATADSPGFWYEHVYLYRRKGL